MYVYVLYVCVLYMYHICYICIIRYIHIIYIIYVLYVYVHITCVYVWYTYPYIHIVYGSTIHVLCVHIQYIYVTQTVEGMSKLVSMNVSVSDFNKIHTCTQRSFLALIVEEMERGLGKGNRGTGCQERTVIP